MAARGPGPGAPSLDRILPEIRRAHPGTFYDAEGPLIGPDGRAQYRIKWMTPEGRVIWFDADARTGRVLEERGRPLPPDFYGPRGRYGGDRFEGGPYDDRRYDDRHGGWGRGHGGGWWGGGWWGGGGYGRGHGHGRYGR